MAFYLGHRFGCASLLAVRRKAERPDPYLTVSFGLAYPLDSPRVDAKTEPYPNRWTHHLIVGSAEELGRGAFGLAGGGRGFCRVKKSKKLLT